MHLYFIRHGQSTNNHIWATTGNDQGRSEDPELTDYGRKQAEIAAHFIANYNASPPTTHDATVQNPDGFGLTHLYASPMRRALDTARPIAQATGLKPHVWVDLHEVWGIWNFDPETGEKVGLPGPERPFFEERWPEFVLPNDFALNGGWWNKPRETIEQGLERAYRFVAQLKERHNNSEDRVAVVSHGGFYNAVLAALLNTSFRKGLWFALNNTGVSYFRLDERGITLGYQNRVDFLPAELIT